MEKLMVIIFSLILSVNILVADQCAFAGGLTDIKLSFYWQNSGDGCWATYSDFIYTKLTYTDGYVCYISVKPDLNGNMQGLEDVSSCGYGDHPVYPSYNNVMKVSMMGSDGQPSYRAVIEPSSTAAQRYANVDIDDLNTNVCGSAYYHEYTYTTLNNAAISGTTTNTELYTRTGCYGFNIDNDFWNMYFLKNIDKKEVRYFLINGIFVPIWVWVDTETLGNAVYKQLRVYITKFDETYDKSVSDNFNEDVAEITPDFYEKEIDAFSNVIYNEALDVYMKNSVLKTGDESSDESVLSTAINEKGEIRGFVIEEVDVLKVDSTDFIKNKIILSVNGFNSESFKNFWDMIEYTLTNDIYEIEVFDKENGLTKIISKR